MSDRSPVSLAEDAAARAESRRRTWKGGVARSAAEMEAVSAEFWLSMTPEERLESVYDLWNEQIAKETAADEAPARLQRSIGGVRPRRG